MTIAIATRAISEGDSEAVRQHCGSTVIAGYGVGMVIARHSQRHSQLFESRINRGHRWAACTYESAARATATCLPFGGCALGRASGSSPGRSCRLRATA